MAEGIVGAVPVALELAEELSHLPVRDGPQLSSWTVKQVLCRRKRRRNERGESGREVGKRRGRGRGNIQPSLETLASVQQM